MWFLGRKHKVTPSYCLLVVGIEQIVDALKSVSLAMALIECEIDVPRAVFLSRLETAFQEEQWGNVEWYHDIQVMETQARVAAATLFVHFTNDFRTVQAKSVGYAPV